VLGSKAARLHQPRDPPVYSASGAELRKPMSKCKWTEAEIETLEEIVQVINASSASRSG
jgi:hypothetical protein